jgi:hypothetical protein
MTLEIVAAVAVAVYLLLRLDAWLAQRWLHKLAAAEAAHIAEQAVRDAAPPAQTTLRVPGTQALPRNQFRRVTRFGLAADRTVDLLMYASDNPPQSWPRHVNDLLRMLYRKGQARGPGVVEILVSHGPLPQGHALYFALLEAESDVPPHVYAFVDRVA